MAVPMCCVTIDYRDYLLPMDKGIKLVELLQSAVLTEKTFMPDDIDFYAGKPPHLELEPVKPSQIKFPLIYTNAAGQHLVGMD